MNLKIICLKNFETAWHENIKFGSHAEGYRRQWFGINGKPTPKIGLKDMLESSKWLLTHLTVQDLFKEVIQGGVAGTAFSVGIQLAAQNIGILSTPGSLLA